MVGSRADPGPVRGLVDVDNTSEPNPSAQIRPDVSKASLRGGEQGTRAETALQQAGQTCRHGAGDWSLGSTSDRRSRRSHGVAPAVSPSETRCRHLPL